jgi:hypothetical protein
MATLSHHLEYLAARAGMAVAETLTTSSARWVILFPKMKSPRWCVMFLPTSGAP